LNKKDKLHPVAKAESSLVMNRPLSHFTYRLPTKLAVIFAALFLLNACSQLSAFNTFAGRDGAGEKTASDIAYGSHQRQQLDVYAPTKLAGKRNSLSPVVVFFYGGSWNSGSRQDYAFVGSALAAKGYVTVIADYRLVPEVVFPTFLDDSALAVRWVRDNIRNHGGDPKRLALAGHSAGAYNAVMLALDTRYLSKAGVDPAIVKAVAALAGPYDFLPFTSPAAQAALGAWPEPAQTQPITFARENAPPAFLATGDADTTVFPRNTVTLAGKLQAQGSNVVVRRYANIDHAGILLVLSKLMRNRAPVLDDMTQFLDKTLREH
jgi:acetyl esterase/lipase